MYNKGYAFPVPNLELETLHTYARLVKEKFPETIYTRYVEDLTEFDLEVDIPDADKRGNFLVAGLTGDLCWGWNPSQFFSIDYEVVSLDDNGNREFLGAV